MLQRLPPTFAAMSIDRVMSLAYASEPMPVVGVCCLIMKGNSYNFRASSIQGGHEAREGQGYPRRGVRVHAGRARFFRFRGHARPRGVQGALRRDRGQPLERRPRRHRGQGVHKGPVQAGLEFLSTCGTSPRQLWLSRARSLWGRWIRVWRCRVYGIRRQRHAWGRTRSDIEHGLL